MNRFHETPITDRATGHTFMHPSYCETPAEAAAYARLTFTNPAVYAVGLAGTEPVVEAAPQPVPANHGPWQADAFNSHPLDETFTQTNLF